MAAAVESEAVVAAVSRGVAPAPVDRRWVPLALVAVYFIWGSTYLAMRVAVEALPPFTMAGLRYTVTGVGLFLFLKLRGAPWPTARQWWAATPVALAMFVLGNATVAMAEKHISSGIAAVVCGTMPLWAAALGRFFGEKTQPREWLGLIIGVAGVAVLGVGQELRADLTSTVLILVAPLAWAVGSLLARKMPMAPGLMAAASQMVVGGVLMCGISVATGEKLPAELPSRVLFAWAYLAVFGSLVAYSAYTYLLRTTSTALATSYSYVNPPIAVVMGVLWGGEALKPEAILSVALVVVATVLVVGARRR